MTDTTIVNETGMVLDRLWSPLQIHMLLEIYAIADHDSRHACNRPVEEMSNAILDYFLTEELIVEVGGPMMYRVADRGEILIHKLLNTPLPVPVAPWGYPDG